VKVLRARLTYANVTSTLALVIALGMGSAFAADQLAPKSVGERQLRPGAVTADKIRKNAVTAPKIKAEAVKQGKIGNGAVSGEKIAVGAVSGSKIAAGAVTPDKIPAGSIGGEKIDEASLSRVPSADTAEFSAVAGSANPEAFARVNFEGTVFPAESKGIGTANVVQGGAFSGIYCIDVPAFLPKGAQVTPEYNGHNNVSAFVRLGSTESCPAADAEVQTYNGGSHSKEPFFIAFYR
jgi:hypothetical protein